LNFSLLRLVQSYHKDKNIYEFFEYYKSGKIAERGFTKDKNKIVLDGAYISYYENDNRKK
jgi:antitoxin component YwqK of YwqJK toxin-antitoxin module